MIIILIFVCIVLSISVIVNIIRLHKLKTKAKKKYYHTTPKLSDLHGKDFADYIDNLTENLK